MELSVSKLFYVGIGVLATSILAGFFESFGSDLYQTSKGVVTDTSIAPFIIPIIIGVIGLGIIIYDIFFRRKHKPEPKLDDAATRRKREKDWRFFPSNYK